ncbi:MAG: type II toxin-antitoxin system prevent-host-death family antitoxin [Propionibacteriaceae bacterium]|jgi:prevent-host-death family protein|nr:type II toxin-antitoxin system prevent-host-death family antitoxin [Propionibacteriaceae bacterium]
MAIVATQGGSSAVGLRELRANLSGYVEQVRAGRSYTLTERGQPVARLVPVASRSNYERLAAQGVIQPAASRPGVPEAPVQAGGTVSDLVALQRR